MDVAEFAANFGLPGLLIAAWYLLQSKRDERSHEIEKAKVASNEKIELERIKVEDKKADAMAAAFTSLSGKIDAHHDADIQSHSEMSEGIAIIRDRLDEAHWTRREITQPGVEPPIRPRTPARGVRAPSRGQFHDEDE